MARLGVARTGLDSFVYWATFVVLSCFVTFFLNTMVELANSEEHQYDTSVRLDGAKMSSVIKARRASSTQELETDAASYDISGE